jgi:hypothetical protein
MPNLVRALAAAALSSAALADPLFRQPFKRAPLTLKGRAAGAATSHGHKSLSPAPNGRPVFEA